MHRNNDNGFLCLKFKGLVACPGLRIVFYIVWYISFIVCCILYIIIVLHIALYITDCGFVAKFWWPCQH